MTLSKKILYLKKNYLNIPKKLCVPCTSFAPLRLKIYSLQTTNISHQNINL